VNYMKLMIMIELIIIIIFLVIAQLVHKYVVPIKPITHAIDELAKGCYQTRIYESSTPYITSLSTSFNLLAINIQLMQVHKYVLSDRLHKLIENVNSAIMLIDGKGYITLTNKTYKEWFDMYTLNDKYQLFYEVIKQKQLISLIEEVLLIEKQLRK